MRYFISYLFFSFVLLSSSHAEEVFDASIEAQTLGNVTQLTFPSMGFEKAGEAYFSPDGNTIIFQAVPKGQKYYQIYTMSLKGRKPRMVSTGKGACTCAFFRPDGKKIIFASSHEDPQIDAQAIPGYKREGQKYSWEFTPYMNIYEANPDGSELKALTSGPDYHAECAYSPDGSHIVFASNSSGSMNLYTMKADGSDVRQITHTTNCYNGGCFFSPDGKQIVFRADRDKPDYLQIYLINVDGTEEKQLTNNDAVNWAPYWHPNGAVITYTTSLHGHSQYEIYGLNRYTGAVARLSYSSTFDGLSVFSPDGSQIMWTSKRGADKTCQIFLAEFIMPRNLR